MFRKLLQRVDFWLIWVTVLLLGASGTGAHSCNEVKTAFQMRQIGLGKWVPDTPGPGGDLQVCKHPGPTCCTRKMEESYLAAVRSETLQKVRSYSFELKYLMTGHASTFQDTFQSLLSFTLNLTSALFDSTYQPISREARPLVIRLFSDLSLFLGGDNDTSVERSVHSFYDDLFPLVYRRLVNPGMAPPSATPSALPSPNHIDCLTMTRQDINPFGPHPRLLAEDLGRALGAGRALNRLLSLGREVLIATDKMGLARECGRGLVRMQYCSHCRGLTLIRPCGGLCLNVMRGCLVGLSGLDAPWRRYVAVLQELAGTLATGHDLELALLAIRNHVNDAILHAQFQGPQITSIVDKVCGPLTYIPSTITAHPTQGVTTPATSTTPATPSTPTQTASPSPAEAKEERLIKRSLPLKPSKNDKARSLKKISREFRTYIQRYQGFFSELPEMLCESEMVVDELTCWNGDDVVKSYVGRVVGNSFHAQRRNPEVSVRSVDPSLQAARERLEQFTEELQGQVGWVTDWGAWAEIGSGAEPGSGECDDEDGCPGSGDEDLIGEEGRIGVARGGVPLGKTPDVKDTPPRRQSTPRPPQLVVERGDAHALNPYTTAPLLLTLLLLPWHLL